MSSAIQPLMAQSGQPVPAGGVPISTTQPSNLGPIIPVPSVVTQTVKTNVTTPVLQDIVTLTASIEVPRSTQDSPQILTDSNLKQTNGMTDNTSNQDVSSEESPGQQHVMPNVTTEPVLYSQSPVENPDGLQETSEMSRVTEKHQVLAPSGSNNNLFTESKIAPLNNSVIVDQTLTVKDECRQTPALTKVMSGTIKLQKEINKQALVLNPLPVANEHSHTLKEAVLAVNEMHIESVPTSLEINTQLIASSITQVKVPVRTASPMKLATVTNTPRGNKRRRESLPLKLQSGNCEDDERKSKRVRTKVQPYQSPLPELAIISKLSASQAKASTDKTVDDKLIAFYKNEFLAVRSSDGGFYVCQTMRNVYKSSAHVKIRWFSQKNLGSAEIYSPDFYDTTDFDCILTNLKMNRIDKTHYRLPKAERERTQNILERALGVETGSLDRPTVTEEHPDGLDLSLYRHEAQLDKKKTTSKIRTNVVPRGSDYDTIGEFKDDKVVKNTKQRSSPRSPIKASKTRQAAIIKKKEAASTSKTKNKPIRSLDLKKSSVHTRVAQKEPRIMRGKVTTRATKILLSSGVKLQSPRASTSKRTGRK